MFLGPRIPGPTPSLHWRRAPTCPWRPLSSYVPEPRRATKSTWWPKMLRTGFHDIKVYLEKGEFAPGSTVEDQKTIARLATKYFLCGDALYRRSYDGMLLLCVAEGQARKLMEEVHGGTCGPHMNGRMLVKKIMRMGYYWSTMESDCISFARKLEKCQTHADMAGLFRSKRDRAHGAITPICLNPGLPPYQQCVLSTLRTGLHLDD